MKTKKQIENEIEYFETRLLENKTQHKQLHQIERLGGEGTQLRKRIDRIEGKIQALKWIIQPF